MPSLMTIPAVRFDLKLRQTADKRRHRRSFNDGFINASIVLEEFAVAERAAAAVAPTSAARGKSTTTVRVQQRKHQSGCWSFTLSRNLITEIQITNPTFDIQQQQQAEQVQHYQPMQQLKQQQPQVKHHLLLLN
ncbi:uncharacterized protein LOC142222357 [Haematobia irritans]|uniref:uncharacterized protein LOC142222357 n=1 Tax=Haematobia irritans TaxID=7368 RepID=UPI003F508614